MNSRLMSGAPTYSNQNIEKDILIDRGLQELNGSPGFPGGDRVAGAVDLSYTIYGENKPIQNPPIFILHGLLGKKKNYRGIGKVLKKILKCTVIPVDLRNHGKSPHVSPHDYEVLAADVIKLFQKLSITEAALIGHSMGGRTAMAVALLEPKLVTKLVIIDISPVSSPKHLSENFRSILIAMKEVDFSKTQTTQDAKRLIRKRLGNLITDKKIMNAITMNVCKKRNQIAWQLNLDVLIRDFDHIVKFPEVLKSRSYFGPTIFIGGQLSDFLPPDDLNPIRKMFPKAIIKYIPKVGHNLHVEDTASFLELTINFFKKYK